MAFTDGVDPTCPVCGGDCRGYPLVPLPSDYPFLSEAQMAEHPKTDEKPDESAKDKPRRVRRRDRRAIHGPAEDRAKKPAEDRGKP